LIPHILGDPLETGIGPNPRNCPEEWVPFRTFCYKMNIDAVFSLPEQKGLKIKFLGEFFETFLRVREFLGMLLI